MITTHDIDKVLDATAYDQDGDRIGGVDTIYLDEDTDEPTFVLVNTGLFGTKSSFVPVEGARMDGDDLRLAYSKDKIKDAPKLDVDDHLDPSQEQELFRYYGMNAGTGTHAPRARGEQPSGTAAAAGTAGTAGTSGTPGTSGRDMSGRGTDDAMTRSEEELHVGTTERETGKARLRKHVVTEHVTKTVPVQREEVHLEREPITDDNVGDATDGPAMSEDEHEVVLHEEEPVVEKRAVPKERVRLEKDVHTDDEEVSEDVDHEVIELIDEDANRGRN